VSVVGELVLVVGAMLVLLAAIGVLRFPDLYSRMHAATKATTLGLLLVGIGALVEIDRGRIKLVLAAALILVTAPVASHLVGRAAYRARGIDLHLDAVDELGTAIDADRHAGRVDRGGP
jgi:multicomponent Na+:H+ antiporter subunit G